VWPEARALLRRLPYAETRAACERLRDEFAAPPTVSGSRRRWRHSAATGSGWWPSTASRRRTGRILIAEKKFRRLNAPELLEDVYEGKRFVDGVAVNKVNRKLAAW